MKNIIKVAMGFAMTLYYRPKASASVEYTMTEANFGCLIRSVMIVPKEVSKQTEPVGVIGKTCPFSNITVSAPSYLIRVAKSLGLPDMCEEFYQ